MKAVYHSVRGRIACSWKREGGKLTIEVAIPANTAASVYVPVEEGKSVTESGKPAARAEGVRFLRKDGRAAVFEVESGAYRFSTGAGRPR